MKKILLFLCFYVFVSNPVNASTQSLSGKILLQVEDKGQAWYVEPGSLKRAYLGRPDDAFRVMRNFGLGISEAVYKKFSVKAPANLSGKILLRADANGEAYYVDTVTLKLHYLGRPSDAFMIMRKHGLGISNADLEKIRINSSYSDVSAQLSKSVNLYMFYGDGCPYCEKEKAFLGDFKKEIAGINIFEYEVWNNQENRDLYDRVKDRTGVEKNGVPFLVIGNETVYGFSDALTTGKTIREIVLRQKNSGSQDIVFPLLSDVFKVTKVVDGDTLDVLVGTTTKRVRVIGIDTPEVVASGLTPECYGQEASSEAKRLLENQLVRLEVDASQDNVDKYGRLLRHVFVNGSNFAELMVRNGFAKEYTYSSASKYQVLYKEAQIDAKTNGRGMWSSETCQNSKESGIPLGNIETNSDFYISNIFFDGFNDPKEGDEYVEIKNKGASQNLKGYTLSDESGKRYQFSDFVISKDASVKVYTGCGTNTASTLYWCYTETAIWNNGGDTAYLKNGSGEVLAKYSY